MNIKPLIAPALAYFALVFSAGFLLGTVRVIWLVQQLGARTAELSEIPVMLIICFFTANWVCRRFDVPPETTARLIIGVTALICLIIVEFTFVLGLQGITIREYIENRNPLSGGIYALSLILFALMPLIVNRSG
ncbi:MAG TPA: hypothetical protein PKL53_07365 [Methylotenera sp.]|nr:hypothetical protein [Methylotenera sp.]HPV44712.1 hypothetical protein [Methylotenera sp.]